MGIRSPSEDVISPRLHHERLDDDVVHVEGDDARGAALDQVDVGVDRVSPSRARDSCVVLGGVESAEGRQLDIMGPKWRRSEKSMEYA